MKLPNAINTSLATWFGLGLSKHGPGTVGTIGGLPLCCGALYVSQMYGGGLARPLFILGAVVFSVAAFFVIETYERFYSVHDDQRIVIDEVAGLWCAFAFADLSIIDVAVAFCAFRLLDIFKPGPIGWIDRNLAGAWGTLGDDLLAGIAAALVLAILKFSLAHYGILA